MFDNRKPGDRVGNFNWPGFHFSFMTLVEAAKLDIGKKEKPNNAGFLDSIHEKEIRATGWLAGYAWCAYQVEAWVWKAFPERKEELKDIFVPSAVNTYRNLLRAGYKSLDAPEVGAIVAWQKYQDGEAKWMGHIGVVSEVIDEKTFKSIEGNTSNRGSRNGDGIYELTRIINREVQDGLRILGFIRI